MLLFLDANVIFAAAATPKGRIQALLQFAAKRTCELVSSRYAIDEAQRNIAVKFPEAAERLERLLGLIEVVQEAEPALLVQTQEYLPLKDAPILAAAIAAEADLLVTGDKRHFDDLYNKNLHGVTIVTPAEALRRILEQAIRAVTLND